MIDVQTSVGRIVADNGSDAVIELEARWAMRRACWREEMSRRYIVASDGSYHAMPDIDKTGVTPD